VRIYYTTDIHGSNKCWRKLLATPKFYQADFIIIGGDITGKIIVPIIRLPKGGAEATFMGRKRKLKKEKDIEELKQIIANTGQYPVEMTQDEFQSYEEDPSQLDDLFRDLLVARVEEWVKMADEKLKDQNVRCYISAGNDDIFEVDEPLAKSNTIEIHNERVVELNEGFQMFGMGYANITPWNCPRDITEDELAEKLETLGKQINDMNRAVLDIHVPPYGSRLDEAPELTEDMSMVLDAVGKPKMVPVGSTAVKDFLLRYQPLISLHGHIHESAGIKKLGTTTIVNPGSEYAEGILRGALIDIDSKKGIANVNLVSG
jgi:Icc-related predicted phosphoesterase